MFGRGTLPLLVQNRLALIGLILTGIVVLGAALAPVLAPLPPTTMQPDARFVGPSWQHPFGTDDFGRDQFSRVLYGARISIRVGLVAISVSTLIGSIVGLIAGYRVGWLDSVIMRVMDILLAFPSLLLALFIIAALGSSITNLIIAISIAYIPFFARVTRGQVLSLSQGQFVEASRSIGAGPARIIVRHILPNVVPILIIQATINIAFAVLAESSLSYLGLGAEPEAPSWGRMLTEARPYMDQAPWMAIFPGLALMALVIGTNLLGDGLRDVLDPRLRGSVAVRARRASRESWRRRIVDRIRVKGRDD
jgi:peptide/nickel transport system permease protein